MRYFLTIALLLFSTPALAQHFDNRENLKEFKAYKEHKRPKMHGRSIMPNPHYDFMAREALKHRADHFNFNFFRVHYIGTRQYDPLGKDTIEKLLRYAFKLKNATTAEDQKVAQTLYTNLIVEHLAHIDVVTQAHILSKDDRRFGDHTFFAWMRRGLLNSVKNSGTGEKLVRAYQAFTIGEETALLASLNIEVLKTIPAHEGSLYYNMHDVRDRKTKQTYSIFVDVTNPMTYLQDIEDSKTPRIILGR